MEKRVSLRKLRLVSGELKDFCSHFLVKLKPQTDDTGTFTTLLSLALRLLQLLLLLLWSWFFCFYPSFSIFPLACQKSRPANTQTHKRQREKKIKNLNERISENGFTWKSSVTLMLFLADVSINDTPHVLASAFPSSSVTSRNAALSSHLLPTNMTGICVISCPFNSLINAQIARNSSRLCFEHTEYTRMNAWPFVIDNRCMAGNWWLPVVSVICRVQMFLLQLITYERNRKRVE